MVRKQCFCLALIILLAVISITFAEEQTQPAPETSGTINFPLPESQRPLPVYLSELTNLNDYDGFANGGWDGNWYPGFNVCWIEKLPAPPAGAYRKAYVGVKLGRMKTRPMTGKPIWEKEPIPGDVYIAISSTPAWKSNQKYFLVSSSDIPLESDPENLVNGVGESRWFWAEVPVDAVSMSGPQFVAVWSPTQYFVSTASSPILAGGWGSQEVNTWMNNDIKGYPPLNAETSQKTPISVFEPAIAMKLIPDGAPQEIVVTVTQILDGKKKTTDKTVRAAISGEGIERAWLEVSADGKTWQKHGRYIYGVPYEFTMKADQLPAGKIMVRCAAVDEWGDAGYSDYLEMNVSK